MEVIQILKSHSDVYVLDRAIPVESYMPLDLSDNNPDISPAVVSDTNALGKHIARILGNTVPKAAYGGYNEKRGLYKRSPIFGSGKSQRNIHIGLDIWAGEGTPVLAAVDGQVHSYNFNQGEGNYGPTIILHHQINNHEFYTLYGHLSAKSIAGLKVGTSFRKGDEIGQLGAPMENGDYPPHLHFQIIRDIGNYSGDYPGVCAEKDLDYYLANCPDPNLLLKI